MVAEAIMKYLQEHGIDEDLLCQKAELAPGRISDSLNGQQKLSIDEYTAVCKTLKISYEYFFELHR